jgi:hypothetical protein
MIQVTQHELNNMYFNVISMHKQDRISELVDAIMLSKEGKKVIFRFDPDLGRRGSWQVKTPLDVIFLEDDGPIDTDNYAM